MDQFARGTQPATLKRVLGLTSLTLYGLGTIIGAGIYVLIGAVADRSGMAAPLAFLAAGVLAGLTGLSYAELGQRFPEAAGAAAYSREGFKSAWMGRIVGFMTLAVAVVAAASITRGGVGYLLTMVDIPLPVASGGVIVLFTALAMWGVRESVFFAAAMTVIEIGGLLIVVIIGAPALADLGVRMPEMWPADLPAVGGVLAGAFLAFFAYAGFENIVNMAEETKNVGKTLPRAVILAILVSTGIYILVIVVSVLAVPPEALAKSDAPLCLVVDCDNPTMAFFAPIALLATLNGVLIEIIMMARISYGMARRGWLPSFIAHVHPNRRTPLVATLVVGTCAFVLTTTLEFEFLAKATSTILLGVFLAVNTALILLKKREPKPDIAFQAPLWVPVAGVLSCVGLLVAEWLT